MAPRRRLPLLIAGALVVAGPVGLGASSLQAAQAADTCVATTSVTGAVTWSTLGTGLRRGEATVKAGGMTIPLHLVEANLATGHVAPAVVANGFTSTITAVEAGVSRGALAAVNGDFFHLTADHDDVVPDGQTQLDNGARKGSSEASPALVVSADGTAAAIGPTKLVGTATFSRVVAAAHAVAAATEQAAAPAATKAPSKAVAKKTTKKVTTKTKKTKKKAKKAKKKAKKKVVKKKTAAKKPTATKTAATTTKTAAPTATTPTAAAAATSSGPTTQSTVLPLSGLDNDLTDGPTVFDSAWGNGDRAGDHTGSLREITVTGGVVTRISASLDPSAVPVGTKRIVVRGTSITKVASVKVGDSVALEQHWVGPSGVTTPGTVLGGNVELVTDGAVNTAGCPLDYDDVRRPRVAVAVSGQKLTVIVTDGDLPRVSGLTLSELAHTVKQLGIGSALNLDGGNSAQLVVPSVGSLLQINRSAQSPVRRVADVLALVPR